MMSHFPSDHNVTACPTAMMPSLVRVKAVLSIFRSDRRPYFSPSVFSFISRLCTQLNITILYSRPRAIKKLSPISTSYIAAMIDNCHLVYFEPVLL